MSALPSGTNLKIYAGPVLAYDGPAFATEGEFERAGEAAFARAPGGAPDVAQAIQRMAAALRLVTEQTALVFASDYSRHDVRDEDVYPLQRAILDLGRAPNLKATAILGSDDGPDRFWVEMTFSNVLKSFDYVEARSADLAWFVEALGR